MTAIILISNHTKLYDMSGKTHKHLHVYLPIKLHDYLKELAKPYGGWEAWLKNIQSDFRRCRERIQFLEDQLAFYKKQAERSAKE